MFVNFSMDTSDTWIGVISFDITLMKIVWIRQGCVLLETHYTTDFYQNKKFRILEQKSRVLVLYFDVRIIMQM